MTYTVAIDDVTRDATPEEIAIFETLEQAAQQVKAQEQAKAAAKTVAQAKLAALGLTTDDLKALGL